MLSFSQGVAWVLERLGLRGANESSISVHTEENKESNLSGGLTARISGDSLPTLEELKAEENRFAEEELRERRTCLEAL